MRRAPGPDLTVERGRESARRHLHDPLGGVPTIQDGAVGRYQPGAKIGGPPIDQDAYGMCHFERVPSLRRIGTLGGQYSGGRAHDPDFDVGIPGNGNHDDPDRLGSNGPPCAVPARPQGPGGWRTKGPGEVKFSRGLSLMKSKLGVRSDPNHRTIYLVCDLG